MLYQKFCSTISAYGMDKIMEKSGVVIAAFSGGADSSLMLHFLADYVNSAKNSITLVCAHINHMIRGEEADGDERFAAETAEKLNIPIYIKREDVPALAKKLGCGLEEAARIVRYAFFDELSEKLTGGSKTAVVATAHNADDNMETVLFHVMRGSGTKGLGGIDPVRDGRFIRPLINITGEEIREFCGRNNISYVVDSTNSDTDYKRNYIRHKIVPLISAEFENPQRSFLRLSELVRMDNDYLESEVKRAFNESENISSYSRNELNQLHTAVASRILMKMYGVFNADRCNENTDFQNSRRSLEYIHIKNMLSLAKSEKCEGSVSLPGEVEFCVSRNTVYFREKNSGDADADSEQNIRVEIDKNGGIFENKMYKLIISPDLHTPGTEEIENIYKLSIHQRMCFDKIIGALYIKYRNKGDTYRYGGMTRKVKRLLTDKKLTSEEKNLLPLVCDESGIVWVPYYPVRDGLKLSKNSSNSEKFYNLYFFVKCID